MWDIIFIIPSQFIYHWTWLESWPVDVLFTLSLSLSLFVYLLLSSSPPLFLFVGDSQDWNEAACAEKFAECEQLFYSATDCAQYEQAIQCFNNYTAQDCMVHLFSVLFWKNLTIDKYCEQHCFPDDSATLQTCKDSFFPPNPTTPPPNITENCTYSTLPAPPHPPLTLFGSPSLSPPTSPTDCTLPSYQTYYRQHCSLFSLSHLRSFGDRSLPLQTCVLYGNVYLLKHSSLSVSVKGAGRLGNSDFYTYITEVNACFTWHIYVGCTELHSYSSNALHIHRWLPPMDCGVFGTTILTATSVGCIAGADMFGTKNVGT